MRFHLMGGRFARMLAAGAATATVVGLVALPVETAVAAQPKPNHGTRLVPDKPRADMPRINNGEIFDIEAIPSLNRVFIAGSFTSLQNTTGANTAVFNQAGLASYNYSTGLIDRTFKPNFGGRDVNAVEASPDGTKLFVGGSFN